MQFIIYLKFTLNWAACILSSNLKQTRMEPRQPALQTTLLKTPSQTGWACRLARFNPTQGLSTLCPTPSTPQVQGWAPCCSWCLLGCTVAQLWQRLMTAGEASGISRMDTYKVNGGAILPHMLFWFEASFPQGIRKWNTRERAGGLFIWAGPFQALRTQRQAFLPGRTIFLHVMLTWTPIMCRAASESSAAKDHRFPSQLDERILNHSYLMPATVVIFFIAIFLVSSPKHSTKGGGLL